MCTKLWNPLGPLYDYTEANNIFLRDPMDYDFVIDYDLL